MILRGLYGVWIIGCVACLIAFMSVFFSSRKTVFKSLLDTYSTPGYLSSFQAFFSYCNLDTSSTPGGLIEKVPVSSIASRQLGRSIELLFVIWCFVPRHMLDTFIYWWPFFSTPTSTDCSTPSSVKIYWWPIYSSRVIRSSFLLISLSIPLSFHLPNLSHSLQTSSSRFLQVFFFQDFLHLVNF